MSTYRETGPYMPDKDSEFREWLANFARKIEADPHRYGLDASDATVIVNHWRSFESAYVLTTDPETRTPANIAAKDAVKASAKGSIRVYAGLIRSNLAIDNQGLIGLGLHPRNNSRSPVPAPTSAPIIMPICGFPGETYLRYADENTPASRRKPPGVVSLQLKVALTPPGQPTPKAPDEVPVNDAFYTKQPVIVKHGEQYGGYTATFFGRWVTARGLFGPWSLPAHFTVCAATTFAPPEVLKELHLPEFAARRRGERKAA